MKRAILPLVASVLCLCKLADAQTVTTSAAIDNACVPRNAIFTVPAGRVATDFAPSVFSGFHCTTGGSVANPAWGISTANTCRTGNVFYQNRNDNGTINETPVRLANLRLGPGQYCLHVDGGKTAKVALTFRLVPGGAPGPGNGPTFGVLGPSGVPDCLLQVGPKGYSEGRLVLANTPYVVWWAPKRAGQDFNQVTSWTMFGPRTLAGGRRYLYRGDEITSNPKPTSTVISPGLASLHFENPDQTEGRWYMINPPPPGCGGSGGGVGGPGRGPGGILPPGSGTGGAGASIVGTWRRTDGEEVYTFDSDGRATGSNSSLQFSGSWSRTEAGTYAITWSLRPPGQQANYIDYLTVAPDGRSFSGVNNFGDRVNAIKR